MKLVIVSLQLTPFFANNSPAPTNEEDVVCTEGMLDEGDTLLCLGFKSVLLEGTLA